MKQLFSVQKGMFGLLKFIGGTALTAMMLLTVTDVIGRFFKHPVFGSVELVGFLAVIVAAAALPQTYKKNAHVGVEIFVRILPSKARVWMDLSTRTLTLVLFCLIAWQMFIYSGDLKETGEVSMNLEFPVHCIVYVLAGALSVFALTIVQSILETIKQIKES